MQPQLISAIPYHPSVSTNDRVTISTPVNTLDQRSSPHAAQ